MSTATIHTSATFAPRPVAVKQSVADSMTPGAPPSTMPADDATALRVVSAIIFAVVAAGTLLMLGTVLLCG